MGSFGLMLLLSLIGGDRVVVVLFISFTLYCIFYIKGERERKRERKGGGEEEK
jgi:uncharacterized membrane protein